MTDAVDSARLIAFYLPQFHPIPENDEWWGRGFTEWTNVVKARPLFRGHYQPQLPADLGFYDLRLPETRRAQADLAREYGIHGFCYYHYWFNGKRLLERPFREVFESGEPDFPFCLCWANETWSRRWDGYDQATLISQTYSGENDFLNHVNSLLPIFSDRRYIKIDGRPLFLIYRANEIPELEKLLSIWRSRVVTAGLPGIYLCAVDSSWSRGWNPVAAGFDASVEFQPAFTLYRSRCSDNGLFARILRMFAGSRQKNRVIRYRDYVDQMLCRDYPEYKMFRCVTPGFDNSSRRVGLPASILHESDPRIFGSWLKNRIDWTVDNLQPSERIVFINAWNEWAEGNHLEPDKKYGRAFLEEIREIVSS